MVNVTYHGDSTEGSLIEKEINNVLDARGKAREESLNRMAYIYQTEMNGIQNVLNKTIELFFQNVDNYEDETMDLVIVALKTEFEQLIEDIPSLSSSFYSDCTLLKYLLNLLLDNFKVNANLLRVSCWKILALQYKHLNAILSKEKDHKLAFPSWTMIVNRLNELVKEVKEIQGKPKDDPMVQFMERTCRSLINNIFATFIALLQNESIKQPPGKGTMVTVGDLILKGNLFALFREIFALNIDHPLTGLLFQNMISKA